MRGSGNGAVRQFGLAGLGWAGLVGFCSPVMQHNWVKTSLVLCLISSHVCLLWGLVSLAIQGKSLSLLAEMVLQGKWVGWFGPAIVPCSPAIGWMQHNYAQTRWELHLRFVSRIDRIRIYGWLARILIRSFCTRRENNFPMSKRQVRCLNLELPITSWFKKVCTVCHSSF